MNDYYELLKKYAMDNDNYKGWRQVHTRMFGNIFSDAFADSVEAQIHFTAALINISQRSYSEAMKKLNMLESDCASDFDEAVLAYFIGLNHELLDNEQEMNEYYGKIRAYGVSLAFPLALHPYYRTAKFAQRASECKKSVYYYRKALEFYDGTTPDGNALTTVSQIIYDVATVYLYMHQYDECEKFIKLSERYNPAENQQRSYVKALLYAVQGKEKECNALTVHLNPILKSSLEPMVKAVLEGCDPHYCVVPQDRTGYAAFWGFITQNAENIKELAQGGAIAEAEKKVSEKLTNALGFMKRELDCRIEIKDDAITVYCKNYCVKTLINEYEALFSEKPANLEGWNFISVNQFENY